ncbi:MAG: hypothetical protein Kow00121_13050 [Elainellaceae cyanobacterium]
MKKKKKKPKQDPNPTNGVGTPNSQLIGSDEADRFNFYSTTSIPIGAIIQNFDPTEDQIGIYVGNYVVNSDFQNVGLIPNAIITAEQFHLGSRAKDRNDRFIYNQQTGELFFDADGIGRIRQIRITTLAPATDLSHANIFAFDNFSASPGKDNLTGGVNNDLISGLGGDDDLRGGEGNDTLDGGEGSDNLLGQGGNDLLIGGAGDDKAGSGTVLLSGLFGGAGADLIFGLDGDDLLIGGSDNDTLNGGSGNDILIGENGFLQFDENGRLSDANDSTSNDVLLGLAGDDTLQGGNGNDALEGGTGSDALKGGNGVDKLLGGTGDDALIGGLGSDTLTGGADVDLFAIENGAGSDVITDYDDTEDWLGLPEDIKFRDLTIVQVKDDTVIRLGRDSMAVLRGVQANQIEAADFVVIPGLFSHETGSIGRITSLRGS